jgi:hypothetical protein
MGCAFFLIHLFALRGLFSPTILKLAWLFLLRTKDKTRADSQLQAVRREEDELRSKIRDLEQALEDVDAVSLTEAEIADIKAEQLSLEQNAAVPCEMDAENTPSCPPEPCQSPGLVRGDAAASTDRLAPTPDAAQQDPLRSQQISPHAERQHINAAPQVFGTVPAFTPLPDDPTVAMILSCNRYTSALSHLETFQNMEQLHDAVQGAQHFMSGRHHVMFVKPKTGALWSLPVVQQGIEQHRAQFEDLVAALNNMEQTQEQEADARAARLALQLAPHYPAAVAHDETNPVRVAAKAHMHNFNCHMPSQLDDRGQWRSMFVDSNRLVVDPKQELAVRSF